MAYIKFIVNSIPVAQPRHRFGNIKNKKDGSIVCDAEGNPIIRAFLPMGHPIHMWKYEVKKTARLAMEKYGLTEVMTEPVVLEAIFLLPRPDALNMLVGRSNNKHYKYDPGILPHWKRPDLDNLEKALKDALKGIVWDDDNQVFKHGPEHGKYYHAIGDSPKCIVSIWTLNLEEWLNDK